MIYPTTSDRRHINAGDCDTDSDQRTAMMFSERKIRESEFPPADDMPVIAKRHRICCVSIVHEAAPYSPVPLEDLEAARASDVRSLLWGTHGALDDKALFLHTARLMDSQGYDAAKAMPQIHSSAVEGFVRPVLTGPTVVTPGCEYSSVLVSVFVKIEWAELDVLLSRLPCRGWFAISRSNDWSPQEAEVSAMLDCMFYRAGKSGRMVGGVDGRAATLLANHVADQQDVVLFTTQYASDRYVRSIGIYGRCSALRGAFDRHWNSADGCSG